MAKIHDPQLLYPFTDYERQARRIPGDEIQSQFEEHRRSIRELIDAINSPQVLPGSIGAEELVPDLLDQIITRAVREVTEEVRRAQQASREAIQHRVAAEAFSDAAKTVLLASSKRLDEANKADEAAIRAAVSAADSAVRAHNIATQVDNTTNDAARAAAVAEDWAIVSHDWAEHMDGPIPANTLAWMGITGDHWSSRWWANYATGIVSSIEDIAGDTIEAVDEFNDLYLGSHGLAPTVDNDGEPLVQGAMYFNTQTKAMYVWTGTAWQSMTGAAGLTSGENLGTGTGVFADVVGPTMRFWSLRPQGLVGISSDANGIIIKGNAPTWDEVTGKPGTMPPSTHTHPITDVTNLQAALDDKYSKAASDAKFVDAGGDVMTGHLGLPTNPATTQAVRRDYVDTGDAAAAAATALKVSKSGDVMTGFLTLHADPDTAMKAVPKQYVDALRTYVDGKPSGATIASTPPATPANGQFWFEDDSGTLFVSYHDGNSQQWVDVSGNAAITGNYLSLAGGTLTGPLVMTTWSSNAGTMSDKLEVTVATGNAIVAKTGGTQAAIYGESNTGVWGTLGHGSYGVYSNGPMYANSTLTVTLATALNGTLTCPDAYATQSGTSNNATVLSSGRICRITSMRNAKTDIVELDDAMGDQILTLQPVSFRFKNTELEDHPRTYFGFIAEDLAESDEHFSTWGIEPERDENFVVITDDEGQAKLSSEPVPNGVDANAIIAGLVNLVQRMDTRIKALEGAR